MQMTPDVRPQHRRAPVAVGEAVAQVRADQLPFSTPCAGWDLTALLALLAHMIGQNGGFAVAVAAGDASKAAYVAPAIRPDELRAAWARSTDEMLTDSADAELLREVRPVEIDPDGTFPVSVAMDAPARQGGSHLGRRSQPRSVLPTR